MYRSLLAGPGLEHELKKIQKEEKVNNLKKPKAFKIMFHEYV